MVHLNKVYQTIVCKDKGNCAQAVLATLFNKQLSEVPNLIEYGDNFWQKFEQFIKQQGCKFKKHIIAFRGDRDEENWMEQIKLVMEYDGGINGFFFASVSSQTFKDVTHAVIINKDLKIVHDPNPNQLALKLKPEDIICIHLFNKTDFYINVKTLTLHNTKTDKIIYDRKKL